MGRFGDRLKTGKVEDSVLVGVPVVFKGKNLTINIRSLDFYERFIERVIGGERNGLYSQLLV